jgi:hypothetical protein
MRIMASVGSIQRQIFRVEEFNVKFKDYKTLRDINDNRRGIPGYPYRIKLKNSCSVAAWKNIRFKKCYSGFKVDVLYADGSIANGRTHLWTVRNTYEEDQ